MPHHTLFIADSSVTIRRVVELIFAGEDVQVVTACDGEEAIAGIPLESPDIVLADINLPRRTGYDVSAFVKGRLDLQHIPVLLLAGVFEPVDDALVRSSGADGVVVKPFEPRQIVARVRALVERTRTGGNDVVPSAVTTPAAMVGQGHGAAGLTLDSFERDADVPTLDAILAGVPRAEGAAEAQRLASQSDRSGLSESRGSTTESASTEITEALVELVTRRVIERLTPGAARDVVAQVVSRIAERFVQEEIARRRGGGPGDGKPRE